MSKSKEYLKQLGLGWRNDKGYTEMYEAVPKNLWKKMLKYDKVRGDKEAHMLRYEILQYVFSGNRSLYLENPAALKESIDIRSAVDFIPEKMLQDIHFRIEYRLSPNVEIGFTRMKMDEYFDFDGKKKREFYSHFIKDYCEKEKLYKEKSLLGLEGKLAEDLKEKLIEFGKDISLRVSETGIGTKLKFRLVDLMVEDYLDKGGKVKRTKNQKTKTNAIELIREMVKTL